MSVSHAADKRTAIGYAGLAITAWSVNAYLVCLLSHIPLFQFLCMTQIVGGLLCMKVEKQTLSPAKMIRGLSKSWPQPLALFANGLFYTYAFRSAPAAHVDLINYLWPTMLVVGEALKRRHGLPLLHVLGMGTSLLGIVTLLIPELTRSKGEFACAPGYLAAFGAALSWALYSLCSSDRSKDSGNRSLVGENILVNGITFGLLHSATGSWVLPSLCDLLPLFGVSIFVYGLAFPFWNKSLATGHYTIVGGMANAIPIMSVGWLVIGGLVDMSVTLANAALLVSLGCWILNAGHSPSCEKTPAQVNQFA